MVLEAKLEWERLIQYYRLSGTIRRKNFRKGSIEIFGVANAVEPFRKEAKLDELVN